MENNSYAYFEENPVVPQLYYNSRFVLLRDYRIGFIGLGYLQGKPGREISTINNYLMFSSGKHQVEILLPGKVDLKKKL